MSGTAVLKAPTQTDVLCQLFGLTSDWVYQNLSKIEKAHFPKIMTPELEILLAKLDFSEAVVSFCSAQEMKSESSVYFLGLRLVELCQTEEQFRRAAELLNQLDDPYFFLLRRAIEAFSDEGGM